MGSRTKVIAGNGEERPGTDPTGLYPAHGNYPMSLLKAARAKKFGLDIALAQRVADADRSARQDLACAANRILELEEDQIAEGELSSVHGRAGMGELYKFDRDGLHFIIGQYWHGPGWDLLLAVQVKTMRGGKPEWPPPSPKSCSNTNWAPKGYYAVHTLADLADAFEGDGRRPA